jgi:hypothetical protein
MSDDSVGRYSLEELDAVISSEVIDFLFYLADDFEIKFGEHELDIYVDIVGNLSLSIPYHHHHILNQEFLEIKVRIMSDKQGYP